MPLKLSDRVRENTATVGSGILSLVGNTDGFRRFNDVLASGDATYYCIEENDKFEIGVGTYFNNTLSRDYILQSTQSGSKINLGGSGVVFLTYPADKAVYKNQESEVVIGPSGIRFFDNTIQKTAAVSSSVQELVYISGIAIYSSGQSIFNEADIVSVSGWAKNYIDSQEYSSTAVSGWADITFLKETSNPFTYISGIAVYASGNVGTGGGGGGSGGVDLYTSGIATYASGQTISNQSSISNINNDLVYVSGLAVSAEESLDIAYISGIAAYSSGKIYNDIYLSGIATYASGQTISNQSQINSVSGWADTSFLRENSNPFVYISGLVVAAEESLDINYISGIAVYVSGNALYDLVEDTSPQLGGNLYTNSFNVSGVGNIIGSTGIFSSLKVNNIDVSVSGHTHVANDIVDFDTAVSGLLPVKNIIGGNNISVSSFNGEYSISASGLIVGTAESLVTTVFNKTGSPMPKMTAVYIDGGQGDLPTIQKARATADISSAGTYGLTYEAIGNMATGRVIVIGALNGLNTDQFNPTAPHGDVNGAVLYLSPTTYGGLTTTKPYAPNHVVTMGTIVRTHQTQGVIEVRVQNGYELEELHNVAITGVNNGEFLQYNSASGLWLASNSGYFSNLHLGPNGLRFNDGTHQITSGLPYGSGNLIDKNKSDIIYLSGLVVNAEETLEINYISGIARYASGETISNKTAITKNTNDIFYLSGLVVAAEESDSINYISGVANYSSGQSIQNQQQVLATSGWVIDTFSTINHLNYVSGIAIYSSGKSIQNTSDIIYLSGLVINAEESNDLSYVSGIAVYTSGKIYNDTYLSGISVYSSGQSIDNEIQINAVSGWADASFLRENSSPFIYLSGLVVSAEESTDINYISGIAIYSSGQSIDNQQQITSVSGWATNTFATNNNLVYVSGISNYASGQSLTNQSNIASLNDNLVYISGLAVLAEESLDINYVSGIAAYSSGRVINNENSIIATSGWVNSTFATNIDLQYISGVAVYSSGQSVENQNQITSVSGWADTSFLRDTSTPFVYLSGLVVNAEESLDITYISGIAIYTSGKIYNDTYLSGIATYASGQSILNQTQINAISGWADSSFLKENSNPFIYLSGLVVAAEESNDITYVSGISVYASGQSVNNQNQIVAVSGWTNSTFLKDTSAPFIYLSGLVVAAEESSEISYVSGIAVYSSGLSIKNQTDIIAVSGLITGSNVSITNPANNRILTSDGTSTGINAESNLIFDGTNLGIGSTSPTTLLHILGTGEGIHSGRVGGPRPHLRLQHANGTVASRTISANGNYVGQVSFEGYNGTSYMEHTGIFGIINGTVTTSSIPTDLVFSAGSSGNTASNERMRITAAGNVGIGGTAAATPPELLSVMQDNNAGRTSILIDNLDQRLKMSCYYESGVGQYAEIQSTNNAETGHQILILNRQGGNVGIGTSSPQTKLHVTGGLRLGDWTSFIFTDGNGRASWYGNAVTNTYLQSEAASRITQSVGNISFHTASAGTAGGAITWNHRFNLDDTGAAWIKTSRAWNDTVPTLSIGNDGDGRLQTRHIWGKAAGGTGTEHLWLQFGNSSYHVQVGNAGQNTNLYVGQDLAVGAYFSGGTAGILGSSGYVYGKRFYNIDAVSTDTGFGLYFNGSTDTAYAIYREAGAWTGTPYPDLRISFHTGIKIGANATYNGVRFYTDYDMSSQVMSVNNASDGLGAGNVFVNNSLQVDNKIVINQNIATPANYYNSLQMEIRATSGTAGIGLHRSGYSHVGIYTDSANQLKFNMNAGTPVLEWNAGTILGTGNYNSYAPTLTGGGASGTWGINVTGTAAGETLGTVTGRGTTTNSIVQSNASVRAPIFYDSNDTNYYLDPNGTSNIVTLVTGNTVYSYNWYRSYGATGWYNETYGGGIWMTDSTYVRVYNNKIFYNDNSIQSANSMFAPIFYDWNNNAFYLDPNGSSRLSSMVIDGQTCNGWIDFPNYTGLRAAGLNNAHFYPNNASFGSWRIAGTRNGWAGIEFDSTGAGNVSLMMNSGRTGVHNNSYGWQWYWENGDFYISKSTFGGNTNIVKVLTNASDGNAIGSVKAFVSFNGQGSPATNVPTYIKHNVSIVYRTTTGEFQINFINPAPSVNYVVCATGTRNANIRNATFSKQAGYVAIEFRNESGVLMNPIFCDIAVFW